MDAKRLNYLSITDSPQMDIGFRWQGHVFWNWYARHLDSVDVGNLHRIAQLDKQLGDYQVKYIFQFSFVVKISKTLVVLICKHLQSSDPSFDRIKLAMQKIQIILETHFIS